MISPSPSKRSRMLAGLAAVLCGCSVADDREVLLSFTIDEPGGAALRVVVGVRGRLNVAYVGLRGELRNRGSEPCHIAVYEHFSEPSPDDLPVLDGSPAPTSIAASGTLLMESVLPPPSDGREYVLAIPTLDHEPTHIYSLPDAEDYVFGIALGSKDFADDVRAWVSVATCAAPDVQIDLGVLIDDHRVDEIDIEPLWPH